MQMGKNLRHNMQDLLGCHNLLLCSKNSTISNFNA